MRSEVRTSKRRSMSRPHGFPNLRNKPSRNAQETQYARWVFHTDQFTRSFASTSMECGPLKSLHARSAGSAPDPCDFLFTGGFNQSGSKNCLFVTHWNSLDGNSLASETPPAS